MRRDLPFLAAATFLALAFSGCVMGTDGVLVKMEGFRFIPGELHVSVGATVTWKNYDASEHTVTSDDDLFDSGTMRRGEEFRWTFDEPGTYTYHCKPHASEEDGRFSGMVGTIIVGDDAEAPPDAPTGEGEDPGSQGNGSDTAPDTTGVEIEGFAFHPEEITVTAGTEVVWTNHDGVRHTVTADDGAFDSGTLDAAESYRFTFTMPGTYRYHCTPHSSESAGSYSGMTGTVVVE